MKRRPILIVFALSLAAVYTTSCKDSRPEGLQFAGNHGAGHGQLVQNGLVIVTHGWIEKGPGDWPEDMAVAIYNRVDPNSWLCGYFDWSEGAKTVNPTSAAECARDVAGPKLTEEITKTGGSWRHIHLIAHSSGCWAISEAAKILARKTKADIHLTFFDAYIPASWQEGSLGNIDAGPDVNCWIEHYYTRDLTMSWTQEDLSFAHNVDISSINGVLRDHNFPWQWYYATITGRYHRGKLFGAPTSKSIVGDIEYGFARSKEASDSRNWKKSMRLPIGNEAVKLSR